MICRDPDLRCPPHVHGHGRCARCGGSACQICDLCHGCGRMVCERCDRGTGDHSAEDFAFPGDARPHPHVVEDA